jgi:hypothetical protein
MGAIAWIGSARRRVAALLVVQPAATWALFRADERFERLTGHPTPDTQNDLTPAEAARQIAGWDGTALAAYRQFAAPDVVFPLAAALLLAVIADRAIRFGSRFAGPRIPTRVAALLLVPAVADHAENVGFLLAAGSADPAAIRFAPAAKAVELAALAATAVLLPLLLLGTGVRWALARRRSV